MKRAAVQQESLAANTAANFLLLQEQKGRKGQDKRQPSAAAIFIQTLTSPGGKILRNDLYQRVLEGQTRATKLNVSISNSAKQKLNENPPPLFMTKSFLG